MKKSTINPSHPAGPGWEPCSFEIIMEDQNKFPSKERYHTTYLEAIGGIELEVDTRTGKTTITVQNGFAQYKTFSGLETIIAFANSAGTTFYLPLHNKKVFSFKEISE
ncbi:MAG: hypothetical protein IT284_01875 [Bacteroidetes bacterium]|nr:hypothetical protein [Bacteroidota bacterium]